VVTAIEAATVATTAIFMVPIYTTIINIEDHA
jgi:hypothetical protein